MKFICSVRQTIALELTNAGIILIYVFDRDFRKIIFIYMIIHQSINSSFINFKPRVAAQAVRWPGIPKDVRPQQVLWLVAKICTVQVKLGRYCHVKGGGKSQLFESNVSDANVRSWLCSTATGNCPLGYFSCITGSSW